MSHGTPRRTVRIDDGLWNRAKERADEQGRDVSEVIRVALEMYVATDGEIRRIFEEC